MDAASVEQQQQRQQQEKELELEQEELERLTLLSGETLQAREYSKILGPDGNSILHPQCMSKHLRFLSKKTRMFKIRVIIWGINEGDSDLLDCVHHLTPQFFQVPDDDLPANSTCISCGGSDRKCKHPMETVAEYIVFRADLYMLKIWRSICEKLEENGGEPDFRLKWNIGKVFMAACAMGDLEMMEWLCHLDPDYAHTLFLRLHEQPRKRKYSAKSPLMATLRRGHLMCADWIVSQDPDILYKFFKNPEPIGPISSDLLYDYAMEWIIKRIRGTYDFWMSYDRGDRSQFLNYYGLSAVTGDHAKNTEMEPIPLCEVGWPLRLEILMDSVKNGRTGILEWILQETPGFFRVESKGSGFVKSCLRENCEQDHGVSNRGSCIWCRDEIVSMILRENRFRGCIKKLELWYRIYKKLEQTNTPLPSHQIAWDGQAAFFYACSLGTLKDIECLHSIDPRWVSGTLVSTTGFTHNSLQGCIDSGSKKCMEWVYSQDKSLLQAIIDQSSEIITPDLKKGAVSWLYEKLVCRGSGRCNEDKSTNSYRKTTIKFALDGDITAFKLSFLKQSNHYNHKKEVLNFCKLHKFLPQFFAKDTNISGDSIKDFLNFIRNCQPYQPRYIDRLAPLYIRECAIQLENKSAIEWCDEFNDFFRLSARYFHRAFRE